MVKLNFIKLSKMRVRTNDGKEGVVVRRFHGLKQDLVKFNNGVEKWYGKHQLTELKADQPTKPPSRERDALINKYQTMLDECRNDGAKAVLVMILNDLK
jgi:hypothetical protein